MPDSWVIYDLTSSPHAQASSSGTANVQTLTPPAGAKGVWLTCTTTKAFLTFDGTTPTSSNGLPLVAAAAPVFFPIAKTIKFASSAAAAAVVDALWVT